jgi:hypothetical protein
MTQNERVELRMQTECSATPVNVNDSHSLLFLGLSLGKLSSRFVKLYFIFRERIQMVVTFTTVRDQEC